MSEIDLIGAALQDPRIATASHVTPADFADPTRAGCWAAIGDLIAADAHPTPQLIVSRMQLAGERAREVAAILVEAMTTALAINSEIYAADVLAAAERARVRLAAAQAIDMLDDGEPIEDVHTTLARAADRTDEDELAAQIQTADEFVDQDLPPESWIIPDLLAAGDRFILTGGEGSGKSILLRMIGMAAAAGVHPFARTPCRPSTVLIVDAENPLRIMVDKFRGIRDALRSGGYETGSRLWIHRQPGGLDLTSPKGRTHLRALCRTVSPDLLIIGPIYKLYVPTDAKDEVHARQVAALLDELRAEHDCAVLTEHHTPMDQGGKRPIRPVGTGLWLRWPEFGFALVPEPGTKPEHRQMLLEPWRGSRDERAWPRRLQGSGGAPGRLPWLDADNLGSPWRVA